MPGTLEPSVQAKSPSQVSKSSLQVKSARQVCKSRRVIALHSDLQACKPRVQACKSSLQVKSPSQVCKSSLPNVQVPAKCQVDLQVCKSPCKYARHLSSEPGSEAKGRDPSRDQVGPWSAHGRPKGGQVGPSRAQVDQASRYLQGAKVTWEACKSTWQLAPWKRGVRRFKWVRPT